MGRRARASKGGAALPPRGAGGRWARAYLAAMRGTARGAFRGAHEVRCLLCGRWMGAVTVTHLRARHGYRQRRPVRAYCAQFGLPVAMNRRARGQLRRSMLAIHRRIRNQVWPRARVLRALRRQGAGGRRISPKRVSMSLGAAVRRHFGDWEVAIARAGLSPRVHRRRRHQSRDAVVAEIRRLAEAGALLSWKRMAQEESALVRAALRHFGGSWTRALQAAGLEPAMHRAPAKWSLAKAQAWVTAQREASRPITAGAVPTGLHQHVCARVPGGWSAFVAALGVPYPGRVNRRDWTDAAVVARIQDRRRVRLPLNAGAVKRDEQALWHQARNRFGGWDAALQAAGVDPARARLQHRWSEARIVAAIRAYHAAGRPMDRKRMLAIDYRLVRAAERFGFGGWGGALARAGLDPALANAQRLPDPLLEAERWIRARREAGGRYAAADAPVALCVRLRQWHRLTWCDVVARLGLPYPGAERGRRARSTSAIPTRARPRRPATSSRRRRQPG